MIVHFHFFRVSSEVFMFLEQIVKKMLQINKRCVPNKD